MGSANAAEAIGHAALRYDGVYRSAPSRSEGSDSCSYLRFYRTGTVIAVTSECTRDTPKYLKKWFNIRSSGPDKSGIGRGRFTLRGHRITFSTISREGIVSHAGTLSAGTAQLDWHSSINGARNHDRYSFIKW